MKQGFFRRTACGAMALILAGCAAETDSAPQSSDPLPSSNFAETTGPCAPVTFDAAEFTVCTVDRRADIRLFWGQGDTPFGHFNVLSEHLAQQGEILTLAMNAGMYHEDRRPVGYYLEQGQKRQNLMVKASSGNFGLLPNGVFYVSEDGAVISESRAFQAAAPKARYATQSGPMLVIDGALHPKFRRGSDSYRRRNGIGVSTDKVYFVISETPVNFHHFARLFKDELGTPNALYLDGVISRLYDPAAGRNDPGLPMGPIIGVAAPDPG